MCSYEIRQESLLWRLSSKSTATFACFKPSGGVHQRTQTCRRSLSASSRELLEASKAPKTSAISRSEASKPCLRQMSAKSARGNASGLARAPGTSQKALLRSASKLSLPKNSCLAVECLPFFYSAPGFQARGPSLKPRSQHRHLRGRVPTSFFLHQVH